MPQRSARISSRATSSILHADLDSFFASVEQRDNPALRGKPVIVGGGVVLAASYEAKAYGVRSPMNGRAALALCPHAVVVPPRMEAYTEASRDVFRVFHDTTPVVEGISVDEAFLDVAGLQRLEGDPAGIAQRLRKRVKEQVGLPISVGISRVKFISKVASAVSKPDGMLMVEAGREIEFLHPLAIERLWGVGAVTAAKLHEYGIVTIGDLAEFGEARLSAIVGRGAGRHLHSLSIAQDPRHVRVGVRRRSIGSQRALGRRYHSPDELAATVVGIVDRLGKRLRDGERVCRTVVLRLRFADFSRATRCRSLVESTDSTRMLIAVALGLLDAARSLIDEKGITLIGLSLANLDDADSVQLALPITGEIGTELDSAADRVRAKYGTAALVRGVALGRGPRWSMPILDDPGLRNESVLLHRNTGDHAQSQP